MDDFFLRLPDLGALFLATDFTYDFRENGVRPPEALELGSHNPFIHLFRRI